MRLKRLPIDDARYALPEASPLVEATLSLLRARVREAWNASDMEWETFALSGNDSLLKAADIAAIEADILASGHRFDWSASISVRERPDIYKPAEGQGADAGDFMFRHPDAPVGDVDGDGRRLSGVGDNVVRYREDVRGTARYIRSNERVLRYLSEGVPAGTIAVIDDSGGTLTAPIIDQFAGVICAGGTVRSHLGILTREYNIPCLMNARVSGIRDGDTVLIEATAQVRTAEDYQKQVERPARVWVVSGAAA